MTRRSCDYLGSPTTLAVSGFPQALYANRMINCPLSPARGIVYAERTECARGLTHENGLQGKNSDLPGGRKTAVQGVQAISHRGPGAPDRLTEWLRQGPPMAQVDRLDWIVTKRECLQSFVTL